MPLRSAAFSGLSAVQRIQRFLFVQLVFQKGKQFRQVGEAVALAGVGVFQHSVPG